MPAIEEKFGRRVKALRVARGMTQAELAEAVDLQPQTISRIELGKHPSSFSTIARLAAALRVPEAALFDFDGAYGATVTIADVPLPADPAVVHERVRRAVRVLMEG